MINAKYLNMKNILLLIILLCSFNLSAQKKIELSVNNLEPRVGEEVTLIMKPDILTEYLKNELGDSIEVSSSGLFSQDLFGELNRVLVFKEAKSYTIGPFAFEFNGTKYETNSISVNVRPKIPEENGLWIRLIMLDGEKYLEIEQKTTIKSNESYEPNYLSYNLNSKPTVPTLAELKQNLTDDIILTNSFKKLNTVNGITTSVKRYKIKFNDKFEGSYLLKKTDFYNLPDEYEIGEIILKK